MLNIHTRLQKVYGNCGHKAIQKMVADVGCLKMCAKWVHWQLAPDLKEQGCKSAETNENTFSADLVLEAKMWEYLFYLAKRISPWTGITIASASTR